METIPQQFLRFLKEEEEIDSSFLLSPDEWNYFRPACPSTSSSNDTDIEIREALSKALPDLVILPNIPEDSLAKVQKALWRHHYLTSKVAILSTEEITGGTKEVPYQFLENIKNALTLLSYPTLLLDKNFFEMKKDWEILFGSPNLRLLLAPPLEDWKTTSLAHFYQKGTSPLHFLKGIPLFCLEPLERYLMDFSLKRQLWKDLSRQLSIST